MTETRTHPFKECDRPAERCAWPGLCHDGKITGLGARPFCGLPASAEVHREAVAAVHSEPLSTAHGQTDFLAEVEERKYARSWGLSENVMILPAPAPQPEGKEERIGDRTRQQWHDWRPRVWETDGKAIHALIEAAFGREK